MRNKVYFLSDVHLGSWSHSNSLEIEKKLVRFLNSIKDEALEIYFLGDIFDYWFEYKTVVPRGFTRFFGTISMLSDSGIKIHFMVGNHDIWFSDYISKEVGATIYNKPIVKNILGKTIRLSHGDAECSNRSTKERVLYKLLRNKLCWRMYASIHPRWTVGLALKFSKRSRQHQTKTLGKIPHAYANEYFDVENNYLVLWTKDYSKKNPYIDYFLFGHLHLMIDISMSKDKRVIVLGDWINSFSYAVLDEKGIILDQFIE